MVSNGKLDLDYLIRADRVRRPVCRLCGGLMPMVLLVFTLFCHISKATGVAVAIPVDGELPSGLDARPVNLTCVAPERPEGEFPHTVALDVVRVFPKLEFEQPIAMVQAPKDGSQWYVATRRGLLWVFENADDVEHRTVALDLQAPIQFTGDKHSQQWGITSLAFHPQFPDRPYLYVAYNARQDRRSPVVSVVARFESMDNGQTFDANSETAVLSLLQDVPNSNTQEVSRFHHLGQIAFGLDGLLYIGFGDPGGDTAQDLSDWHGSILRIDIDGGEPYAIPPDNPFVGIANVKEEIYAYGFRNPWRFSFDRETGDLWVGDVGGEAWEEVDLVVPGGNYGWKIMEGHHCVVPDCDPTGFIPPVIDYSHEVGAVVIGGFVYRGAAIPALTGSYVFGDGTAKDIWRLVFAVDGTPERQSIAHLSTGQIHVFGQDHAGELYFMSARSVTQGISKIVAKATEPPRAPGVPMLLTQTGCAEPANPREPASGAIPYRVNSPLWSDGAVKTRWMAIPEGTQIVAQSDGDVDMPIGTVLVENFAIDDTPVETRLLIRHNDGGWAGYSYEWLDDGSDAVLLESGKTKVLSNGQMWMFPSRMQCMLCHNQAASYALGLELAQLNGEFAYPSTGRSANQLLTLQHIGVLHDPQGRRPDQLPVLAAAGEPDRSIEARARSYLHVNCSGCHRPEGPTQSLMDLRFFIAIESTNICNVAPQLGDLGIEHAALIAPGAPERSIVYQRIGRRGPQQMPPFGTLLVDGVALEMFGTWILSEPVCSSAPPTVILEQHVLP